MNEQLIVGSDEGVLIVRVWIFPEAIDLRERPFSALPVASGLPASGHNQAFRFRLAERVGAREFYGVNLQQRGILWWKGRLRAAPPIEAHDISRGGHPSRGVPGAGSVAHD